MEYIAIDTLKTWDRNYRQGDVGAIVTSLQRFGFNGALRVWHDGVVIAGNHTLLALRECGRAGVVLKGDGVRYDGDTLSVLTVDVSHLSQIEAQAFAIADNRTAALGMNDDLQLVSLLEEVASTDDGLLIATGYDGDDLDFMLNNVPNDVNIDLQNEYLPDDASPADSEVTPSIRRGIYIPYADINLFEKAIEKTQISNRQDAIRLILVHYLEN